VPSSIVHGLTQLRVATAEHEDARILAAARDVGRDGLEDREEVGRLEEPVERRAGCLAERLALAIYLELCWRQDEDEVIRAGWPCRCCCPRIYSLGIPLLPAVSSPPIG
jgi:hypothetical protein